MIRTKRIDVNSLNTLSSAEKQALIALFQTNNSLIFEAKKSYEQGDYKFIFSQTLIRGDTNKDLFEVFDTATAKTKITGKKSTLYPSLGSIQIEDDNISFTGIGSRILKSLPKKFKKQILDPLKSEEISIGNTKFLIMDKAKGCTLEELIEEADLTVNERINLTIAILEAVKSQVADKGLIHRNLNPSHIMIDMENKLNPVVTIISYRTATTEEVSANKDAEPAYRALDAEYSPASDVYSIGRILCRLWGDKAKNYGASHNNTSAILKQQAKLIECLFSEPKIALFSHDKEAIKTSLSGLLKQTSDQRSSLDDAIEQFRELKQEKYTYPTIQRLSSKELYYYEVSIPNRIARIQSLLPKLTAQSTRLRMRNREEVANRITALHTKLHELTDEIRLKEPLIDHLKTYQDACVNAIQPLREELQKHRNLNWVFGEILAAIGLLFLGYAVAVGVKYALTGKLGIFSQTRSDQIAEEIIYSANQLSP